MTVENATTAQPTGQARDILLALKPQWQASKILLGNIPSGPRSNGTVKPIAGIIGVTRKRRREWGRVPCKLLDEGQGKLLLTDNTDMEIIGFNGDNTPMPTNTSNDTRNYHDRTTLLLPPVIIATGKCCIWGNKQSIAKTKQMTVKREVN
jgi:hypothetical protein